MLVVVTHWVEWDWSSFGEPREGGHVVQVDPHGNTREECMVLARLVETDRNGTHSAELARQIFFFFFKFPLVLPLLEKVSSDLCPSSTYSSISQ